MATTMLCLHGWGGSKESFAELREALRGEDIEIVAPDLPGFGAEPEPDRPWSIEDYADWVETFVRRRNIRGPMHLLGHSLGGQVAVLLALRGSLPIARLYLCAAAAVRPRFSVKRSIGYVIAKVGKALLSLPVLRALQPTFRTLLYKIMGVHDYERASPLMQKTMLRVTHEDLSARLGKIRTPTDIFWGTDDRLTPVEHGKRLHASIAGSALHLFPGMRHGIHRTKAAEIAAVIRRRIG